MAASALLGYIIHRRPFRETSLLIDYFTYEVGRLTVVAKGARGSTKTQKKNILQPLQKIEFDCYGRSNLKTLGRAEVHSQTYKCEGKALYSVFYINEVLQRALPESEPYELLFEHYEQSLDRLSKIECFDNKSLEPILRSFELIMLEQLGYLPDLTVDFETGQPIEPDAFYQYSLENGIKISEKHKAYAISGDILQQISQQVFTPDNLPIAKYICRMTLPLAIGDKPIKSRELFI